MIGEPTSFMCEICGQEQIYKMDIGTGITLYCPNPNCGKRSIGEE